MMAPCGGDRYLCLSVALALVLTFGRGLPRLVSLLLLTALRRLVFLLLLLLLALRRLLVLWGTLGGIAPALYYNCTLRVVEVHSLLAKKGFDADSDSDSDADSDADSCCGSLDLTHGCNGSTGALNDEAAKVKHQARHMET